MAECQVINVREVAMWCLFFLNADYADRAELHGFSLLAHCFIRVHLSNLWFLVQFSWADMLVRPAETVSQLVPN